MQNMHVPQSYSNFPNAVFGAVAAVPFCFPLNKM